MAEKKPDYRAYAVIKREGTDEQGKPRDFWLNIGAGFRHEDGQGMNVLLQALPVDGKLVIRKFEEKPKEPKDDL